jgi:hypothetical protein
MVGWYQGGQPPVLHPPGDRSQVHENHEALFMMLRILSAGFQATIRTSST